MVTSAQLAFTQSPISSLLPSVGNTVTVKLDDSNYVTWNFQIELLLEGNGIMGFLGDSIPCPAQHTAIETGTSIVIDNSSVTDAYKMKIDLQNIKKWAESIDFYLQMIKDSRDQLAVIGVNMSDEDIFIVALKGLPPEYNTIEAVIRGRKNLVSLKELRSQLKAEEATFEEGFKQPLMTAMYANSSGSMYESGETSGTKPSS
ncbi:unnamed protein product [Malus baccata var. baccata]